MHPCFNATTEFGTELINCLVKVYQVMISIHLSLELISRNACADLHEEDDAHEDGEGGGHAVVLLDRAAAAEEGDEEDDAADDDEEDGGVEELVPEEVEVLGVGTLDHSPYHYQEKARKLRNWEY